MSKYILCGDPHCRPDNLDKINKLLDLLESYQLPIIMLGDTLDSKELIRGQCLNLIYKRLKASSLQWIFLIGNHCWFNNQQEAHSLEVLKTLKNVQIVDKPYVSGPSLFVPYYRNPEDFRAAISQFKDVKYLFMHQDMIGMDWGNGHIATEGNQLTDISSFKQVISGHYHCFSMDTEVLTKLGWKFYNDISYEDEILTMNIENDILEYNKINNIIEKNVKENLINITTNCIDLLVTKDHRILCQKKQNDKWSKPFYFNAGFPPVGELRIPSSREFLKEDSDYFSDDILKLIVWISADGTFDKQSIRFNLKRKDKIDNLMSLLNKLNIKYNIMINKYNVHRFRISTEESKPLFKLFKNKIKQLPDTLRSISSRQAAIIINEYGKTDGSVIPTGFQISTSKKKEADLLQELAIKCGYRCTYSIKKYKNIKHNNFYILSICTTRQNCEIHHSRNFETVYYEGKVWCLSVNNSNMIVRRNGKASIAGNCFQQKNNLTYIGTPFSHNFGESNQDKYLGLFDTDTGDLSLIKTDFPKHVTVNLDLSNPHKFDVNNQDHFRLIIKGTREQIDNFDASPYKGFKIIPEYISEVHKTALKETQTPSDIFSKWFLDIKKETDQELYNLGIKLLNE